MFFESFLLNLSVLFVLIVALTFDYVTKFFSYWYVRHIPNKICIPFFGSDYYRVLGLRSNTEEVNALCQKYPKSDLIGCVKSRIPDLIIKDPKTVELIISKEATNFNSRGISLDKSQDVCLKNNLFYAEGEKWNLLRRNLESILKSLQWKIKENEENVDKYLHKLKGEVNMQIISQNILDDVYVGLILEKSDTSKTCFAEFRRNLQDRSLSSTFKNYMKTIFPSLYTKFRLNTLNFEITNKLKNLIKHSSLFKEIEITSNSDKSGNSIDMATEMVISLITEGYIQCLNTVTCAFYELAKHPEKQDKLRSITSPQEKNDYLNCVIKETLRLYPQHAVITRKCTKTYRFSDRDLLLDRGVTITIPVEAIHRDNKYFHNPNEFNPERFSAKFEKDLTPCSFLSYGDGPRKCIGEELSMGIMRKCLNAVLTAARLETCMKTPKALIFKDHNFSRALVSDVYLQLYSK